MLQVPVLIYWGANDPSARRQWPGASRPDSRQNPRVQMIIVDKAGHFLFREYPEAFVKNVTEFIDYWAAHPDDTQISANPNSPDQAH